MKKYLIVLAAAVVALASCNNGGAKYTSIAFEEQEITVAEGSVKKLQLLWQPTTIKDAPVCVWESSKDTVVAVDENGNISALAIGEANITATYGEGENALKAVCHVTVKSIYDMLEWSNGGLFGELGDSIGTEYQHWDNDDSCYYKTQNFLGTFYIWSSGITFVNGVGFSGAGFFMEIEAPVGVIQEGDWAGYYYMPELLFTDTLAPTAEGAIPAGSLTDAAEWHEYLYNDSTYDGDGSFKGAPIHFVDFDAEDQTSFIGFVKEGALLITKAGAFYDMEITWFNMEEGMYGLKMEQGTDGKWHFVEPYEFTSRFDRTYQLLPQAGAPKHKVKPISFNKAQVNKVLGYRAKDKFSKK